MKSNSLNRLVGQPGRGSLIVSAVLLATSGCVYAQTSAEPSAHQITRAEVRHELKELEAVGYRLVPNDLYYPGDIQAAEEKLAAKHQGEQDALRTATPIAQTKPTP